MIAVHSIDIIYRMREEILKGLPAYASGGAVNGQIKDAVSLAKNVFK